MSKLITPEAILSYPNVFEPKSGPQGGEPFYSCAVVFPEGTDLTEMKRAAIAVAEEKWGVKAKDLIKAGKVKLPFRTDVEEKGYPDGSTFFNAKSKTAPGIVSKYAGPDGKPAKITDPEEIYPGVKARLSVRFYAYDTNGNRGVAVALGNIQKLADGPRMDGRMKAEDEFDAEAGSGGDDDLLN